MRTNRFDASLKVLNIILICFFIMAPLLISCGGGGGGGGGGTTNSPGDTEDGADLSGLSLDRGGSAQVTSNDDEVDGASIYVPPNAVGQDADLSISTTEVMPSGSPAGLTPVGKIFEFAPTGLLFEDGNEAVITLPIPPGDLHDNLYIGRWNAADSEWENLGGDIDGDFISADVDHLSLYGVFYSGKSLVRIVNDMDSADDPADSGIGLKFISGPVPSRSNMGNDPFTAYRPISFNETNLAIDDEFFIHLLPGQYKFQVSYPSPSLVTNELTLIIPEIDEGSDDGFIDQTISITSYNATSTDTTTDDSIDFSGRVIVLGADPPTIECTAIAPAGVSVVSSDPSDGTLPSQQIVVGPIKREQLFGAADGLELIGTATDPEGSDIDYYWTRSRGTLPDYDSGASGESVELRFPTSRAGTYHYYLTAYDDGGQFAECHWTVIVQANAKPTMDVIVDDAVVDYGRLGSDGMDGEGFAGKDRYDLAAPPDGVSWCNYVDTDNDGLGDRTHLKRLAIEPASENPDHIYRPTQYPDGMTCAFAIVGDTDGDPLTTRFRKPTVGDFYNALTGEKLSTPAQLEAYSELLTANTASFPVPPILAPLAPDGLFALPIIWEAEDNAVSTLSSIATHDCRHFPPMMDGRGACVDIPGTFPDGGVINIVATTTDGFSREQIGFGPVGYGEDDIVRLSEDSGDGDGDGDGGSGENNAPTCSSASITTNQDESVTVDFSGSDVDGDTLTYQITGHPANGVLSGDTYTPDNGYTGNDSITFVMNDGSSDSAPCTVSITISEVVEERKWYVFKLSGVGYHKTYGAASKVTGHEYQALWLLPSEVDGIVGTDFDNTTACERGPWPGPVLAPAIWESRSMEKTIGPLDSYDGVEPYRCPVPNWVYNNPICNQWVFESDYDFYNDIDRLCGN